MVLQHRVGLHCRENGEGIGQAGAFDHQPAEGRHQPAFAFGMQVLDGLAELAADGATEAAGLEQHHRVVDALQQMVVEAYLTELVDQHRCVAESRIAEQALQQGRLARAEKARDEVDRCEVRGLSHRPPPAG